MKEYEATVILSSTTDGVRNVLPLHAMQYQRVMYFFASQKFTLYMVLARIAPL